MTESINDGALRRLGLAELARETRSSIEVTRNAKGDYQWVLKIYYEADWEVALGTLKSIDNYLRQDYL